MATIAARYDIDNDYGNVFKDDANKQSLKPEAQAYEYELYGDFGRKTFKSIEEAVLWIGIALSNDEQIFIDLNSIDEKKFIDEMRNLCVKKKDEVA